MSDCGLREVETDECFPIKGLEADVMGQNFEVKESLVLTHDSESVLELKKLKIY